LDIIAFADGETNVELSIDRFADQDGLGVAGRDETNETVEGHFGKSCSDVGYL
jgi:hypothetical protein